MPCFLVSVAPPGRCCDQSLPEVGGDGAGDLPVRHDMERAIAVAQLCHVEAQVLYPALEAGDLLILLPMAIGL